MEKNQIIIGTPAIFFSVIKANGEKLCEAKKLPYHSLKGLDFPITWKEYEIHKVQFS